MAQPPDDAPNTAPASRAAKAMREREDERTEDDVMRLRSTGARESCVKSTRSDELGDLGVRGVVNDPQTASRLTEPTPFGPGAPRSVH
jgi:hypothetical protein